MALLRKIFKKYLFDRVVMTTHNHGCGNAQKNIQKNILWVRFWWLDIGMVVALLRKIFQKIFVVWDGDSWAEPWLWHCAENIQTNIQKNILWMGWWWPGKAMFVALLRILFKKYSLDRVVMAGQSHGCGTTQKNIQTNIILIGWWWLGKPWLWHCSKIFKQIFVW